MGQRRIIVELLRIAVDVPGLGSFELRGLTRSAVDSLADWRSARARGGAGPRLDAVIAASIVSPSLSCDEINALPARARARLRWAVLDVNDARSDYLGLRGTTLTLDERALVALDFAHRRQVRRLVESLRRGTNTRTHNTQTSLRARRPSVGRTVTDAYRASVAPSLGMAYQPGGAMRHLVSVESDLGVITRRWARDRTRGIVAAIDGSASQRLANITAGIASQQLISATAGVSKPFGVGLAGELARIRNPPSIMANAQRIARGAVSESLGSIVWPEPLFIPPRKPLLVDVSSAIRDALRAIAESPLQQLRDSPMWRELDELWDRAKGHLFEWLFSHLDIRTLRALLTDDSSMEVAAVQALTDARALLVLRESVAEAPFLSKQNRRWLLDALDRLADGDDADLTIPSLMNGTEGAARDLARSRGLLIRKRGNDLIRLPNGKPMPARAMDDVSNLILVKDGHAQLVVQAYGRGGSGYRHGSVQDVTDPEIRRHLATVLLVLVGVLDEAGYGDPLEAAVLLVELAA